MAEEKAMDTLASKNESSLIAFRSELKKTNAPHFVSHASAENEDSQTHQRIPTGIAELDRVLGGGLVPDSFILLGGDPGIGKSTLLLQVAKTLPKDCKIFYVSGEESVQQISSRAKRLGIQKSDRLFLAAETQLEQVIASVQELEPHVLIMDSLQTFASSYLESAPGSVSQVREVAARLMTLAKTKGIAIWLVGHVTKEGSIAGPKTVEHMVDTVLYFEGDGALNYRLLRAVKNRFGSARELGVFEMSAEGLNEVTNPSQLFLSDRTQPVSGTAIACSIEGSRPLLVELQALVSPSPLSMPRRTAVGMDYSRIALIAAILERHMHVTLAQQDLFFNVAGGLSLSEPACDLAAAAAIWSSQTEQAWPENWIFMGELALTGEVRRVPHIDVRLEEAKKLGFKTAVIPASSAETARKVKGIEIIPVSKIKDLSGIKKQPYTSKNRTDNPKSEQVLLSSRN